MIERPRLYASALWIVKLVCRKNWIMYIEIVYTFSLIFAQIPYKSNYDKINHTVVCLNKLFFFMNYSKTLETAKCYWCTNSWFYSYLKGCGRWIIFISVMKILSWVLFTGENILKTFFLLGWKKLWKLKQYNFFPILLYLTFLPWWLQERSVGEGVEVILHYGYTIIKYKSQLSKLELRKKIVNIVYKPIRNQQKR